MNLLFHALGVILESPFALFAPGFLLVRRLPLNPSEKAACSVGASVFLLYLYSFLVFVLSLPAASHFLFTAAGVAIVCACRKDLRLFFSQPDVQLLFLSFAALAVWTAMPMELIRNFSGGDWMGDWFEHYHRTILFLRHLPLSTIFLNFWPLPARPPLFNLVAGHFLAEFGSAYPVYEMVAMLMNLTVFLPACLFLRNLAPRWAAGPLALAVIMALNPSVVQNATYSWTKLLACQFVLLGIWFYCRFLTEGKRLPLYLAFAALSMAFLTHFSAGPYVFLVTAHYLWRSLRSRQWNEIAGLFVVNTLILATWFGWSIAHFGIHLTFGANGIAAVDAQHGIGKTLQMISANVRDTVVPPFLRSNNPARHYGFSLETVRDYAFELYESNLFLALGSVGWFIALRQLIILVKGDESRKQHLGFWAWLVAGAIILGVASLWEPHPWGLAHLALQPFTILGLVLVAAAWPALSNSLRALLCLGFVVDFGVGIALQTALEHRGPSFDDLYTVGYYNRQFKLDHHLTFLGDVWPTPLFALEILLLGMIVYRCYRIVTKGHGSTALPRVVTPPGELTHPTPEAASP